MTGVNTPKMTVTNQNHLHTGLKRGEGNSPFTLESVFHIFVDGCFNNNNNNNNKIKI